MKTIVRIRYRGATDEYRGATVDSIIRRIFGQKALFVPSADPNSPTAGIAGKPARTGGTDVLAVVVDYVGESGLEERAERDWSARER